MKSNVLGVRQDGLQEPRNIGPGNWRLQERGRGSALLRKKEAALGTLQPGSRLSPRAICQELQRQGGVSYCFPSSIGISPAPNTWPHGQALPLLPEVVKGSATTTLVMDQGLSPTRWDQGRQPGCPGTRQTPASVSSWANWGMFSKDPHPGSWPWFPGGGGFRNPVFHPWPPVISVLLTTSCLS